MRSTVAIGIAGGTCSGKSTLASAISKHYGDEKCCILAMDNFYKQQPDHVIASGAVNFERPEAVDLESLLAAVQCLRHGREVYVPVYDRKLSSVLGTTLALPRPVLIVDGLFALFDQDLRRSFDLAVFVETDAAVRLSRRLQRDIDEYGLDPDAVHRSYERYVLPAYTQFIAPTRAAADLVVSGVESVDSLLIKVLARLDAVRVSRGK